MRILAFGHQKRVGKDTASRFAMTHVRSNNLVRSVQKKGFADKLKDVCYQLYAWAGMMPGPWYEEPQNEKMKEVVLPKLGKSPRQIWIAFGNKVKEAAHPGTWMDYVFETSVGCDLLIISDMRFPAEADAIRARGGKVVRILRPEIPHTSDEADDPLLDYKHWDATIVNTELRQFHVDVLGFVGGMFSGKLSA